MASQCLSFVLAFLLSLNAALDRTATAQEVEPASPLPQRSLMPMLRIDWTRGPNLPQGFQDSDGGILENRLITVCGFCSGGLDRDNQEKPGVYPRGFLQKGWSIDLSNGGTWEPIPDFPGDVTPRTNWHFAGACRTLVIGKNASVAIGASKATFSSSGV